MSEQTPAQRIKEAIERLEELRDGSTPGPWEWRLYDGVRDSKSRLVRVVEPENEYGYDRVELLAEYLTRGDADLICTFHATIDPILAILNRFSEYPNRELEEPVMALADAILSGGTE